MSNNVCFDGCPIIFDASCAEYTGETLPNIDVAPYDTVEEVLIKLNDLLDFARTPFIANSTNTVSVLGGGVEGHSPKYSVRLNPSTLNAISSSSSGIKVVSTSGGDGKVKVNDSDIRDYLETKFAQTDDDIVIMTVTPVKVSEKIQFVPSISIETLLGEIKTQHSIQFCEIISDCIPHAINY